MNHNKILPIMKTQTKILIIDDEEDIIEFLSYNLEKEDYQVKSTTDAVEGLKMAYDYQPELVILDIMMPVMNGIEWCTKFREDDAYRGTLVAFLTARDESFTEVAAFEAGADDFIIKPIKPAVLKSRINALLRRHEKNQSKKSIKPEYSFGDLLINTDEYSVRVGDKYKILPKKEFELLRLLVSKPDKVFKREDILKKVWGTGIMVGDRTIDVHIRKIREKIGNEYIKTLKGVGYKFNSG